MKRIIALVLSVLFIGTLFTGCGSSAPQSSPAPQASSAPQESAAKKEAPKTLNLKLGTIRDDKDPSTAAAKKYAELVDKASNGTIKINIFNNSQLGGLTDMYTGMQTGTVDMMYERISSYGWMEGAKMFNIMSAPFLWESYEEMIKALETDEFKKYFEQAAGATGVRAIKVIGDTEARQLSSNKPIKSAADFKGLKIRVAEAVVVQETMKALEAQPQVVPFTDLYMALRQNTVDAQENGFLTIKNQSFFEVQKYVMKTDYIKDVNVFFISDKLWKSLSDEQRKILVDCGEEPGKLMTELTRAQEKEALDFLKTKMEYIDIDLKSIREKLGDVYQKLDGKGWTAGTYEVVKKVKEKIK